MLTSRHNPCTCYSKAVSYVGLWFFVRNRFVFSIRPVSQAFSLMPKPVPIANYGEDADNSCQSIEEGDSSLGRTRTSAWIASKTWNAILVRTPILGIGDLAASKPMILQVPLSLVRLSRSSYIESYPGSQARISAW